MHHGITKTPEIIEYSTIVPWFQWSLYSEKTWKIKAEN